MVAFRGRSAMRFYMPTKPNKWGLKFHSLVESKTSYYYELIFDPGKLYNELIAPEQDELFTKQIVLSLLTNLKNKRHKVFFDNWYSSISLAKELNSKCFFFISTIRQNIKNFPEKNLIENSSKHYAFDFKDNLIIQNMKIKKIFFLFLILLVQLRIKKIHIIMKTEELINLIKI